MVKPFFAVLVSFCCSCVLAGEGRPKEFPVYQNHYESSIKAINRSESQLVNINSASANQLADLKGVGLKKAEAIIEWRKKYGGFKSLDDLVQVKGIGQVILESNRSRLTL